MWQVPAEQGPGQCSRIQAVQHDRIVFSSGARYWPASGSHGARRRARSCWLARLIHWPTAVNRSFPAAVNAQTAMRSGRPADRSAPAGSAGQASLPAAARSPRPAAGRQGRIRLRAERAARDNAIAGMPHTSFMQTSETYVIRWPASINSAIPPDQSHATQNGITPEHAEALVRLRASRQLRKRWVSRRPRVAGRWPGVALRAAWHSSVRLHYE
jgi:hypothetical protein